MSREWDPPAPEENQGEYARLVELILSLPETYRRVLELKFVEETRIIAGWAGTRGVITEDEIQHLKDAVQGKLFGILSRLNISNEDFKESISSECLCPLYGISRQSKPGAVPTKPRIRQSSDCRTGVWIALHENSAELDGWRNGLFRKGDTDKSK